MVTVFVATYTLPRLSAATTASYVVSARVCMCAWIPVYRQGLLRRRGNEEPECKKLLLRGVLRACLLPFDTGELAGYRAMMLPFLRSFFVYG